MTLDVKRGVKSMSSASSAQGSSAALRSLLIRAWRERWGDVQWGIQVKTVIPKGATGDSLQIPEAILAQALTGPTPNATVLGYLRHSLAAQIVSHAAVLDAVAKFDRFSTHPHCTAALISLVDAAKSRLASARARTEECMQLAASLLRLVTWLLRVILASLVKVETPQSDPGMAAVDAANAENAVRLLRFLALESEFSSAMLHVARTDEREVHYLALGLSKQVLDALSASHHLCSTKLRPEFERIAAALRTLDPAKVPENGKRGAQAQDNYGTGYPVLQPLLAFEAVLRPTSDLTALSHHIHSIAQAHGLNFPDTLYHILRGCLSSLCREISLDAFKWDAFVLIRMPALLERLASLMRVSTGAQLRTPTDAYKAFDRLLTNDRTLLDSVDVKCSCNVVEVLLGVCCRGTAKLLTDTESDDVLKERKRARRDSAVPPETAADCIPESVIGGSVRDMTVTAKASDKMSSILKTLEIADCSKPESMESLLGAISQMIKGDSFDLLLAVASANGKLDSFLRAVVRFNQQSQESQGESVKNSLLRAALFDMTFLMLAHAAYSFGPEVVLNLRGVRGTLIETWISDMMVEDSCGPKQAHQSHIAENAMVDQLLQQLNSGDLRTQVVKWQNVCVNMPMAVKEMVMARSLGQIDAATFRKMLQTACSKLCALPVCVVTWLLSYRADSPSTRSAIERTTNELLDIVYRKKNNPLPQSLTETPHAEERAALMATVIRRAEEHVGRRGRDRPGEGGKIVKVFRDVPLKDSLKATWERIASVAGYTLDLPSLWSLQELYRVGGTKWFVESLLEELLSVVYQDDLDHLTDTLVAVLHLDLERCTVELLSTVLPEYLESPVKTRRLTDPHGTAVAKVVVTCLYACLSRASSKRGDEPPDAKVRRIDPDEVPSPSGVTAALNRFLTRLQAATISKGSSAPVAVNSNSTSQSFESASPASISPASYFSVAFVEQAARRGRCGARASLLLPHLPPSAVANLVRVAPERFSTALLAQIFDAPGSPAGRKNLARAVCLLRNVRARRKAAGEAEET